MSVYLMEPIGRWIPFWAVRLQWCEITWILLFLFIDLCGNIMVDGCELRSWFLHEFTEKSITSRLYMYVPWHWVERDGCKGGTL